MESLFTQHMNTLPVSQGLCFPPQLQLLQNTRQRAQHITDKTTIFFEQWSDHLFKCEQYEVCSLLGAKSGIGSEQMKLLGLNGNILHANRKKSTVNFSCLNTFRTNISAQHMQLASTRSPRSEPNFCLHSCLHELFVSPDSMFKVIRLCSLGACFVNCHPSPFGTPIVELAPCPHPCGAQALLGWQISGPSKFFFNLANKKKSDGARSGEYGGEAELSHRFVGRSCHKIGSVCSCSIVLNPELGVPSDRLPEVSHELK